MEKFVGEFVGST